MATYTKLSPGSSRVQVRRKALCQRDVPAPRRRTPLATEPGAKLIEVRPTKSRIARLNTFGDLIDLHIDDMSDAGKSPRRSKAGALDMLQRHFGKYDIAALDRERLIRFGRDRAAQRAGPTTLAIDLGFIKLVLSHAAAVHAPIIDPNPFAEHYDLERAIDGIELSREIPFQPALQNSSVVNTCRARRRKAARRSKPSPRASPHRLPSGRHLPHGRRCSVDPELRVRGLARPARLRQLGHAAHRVLEHQRSGDQDRREAEVCAAVVDG